MLVSARLGGVALLVLLWAGPLPALAGQSMVVHMALHIAVVALVPALLVPRLPGTPGPVLLAAATLVEMMVVWAWHAPAAHHWARTSGVGFALEQAMFLATGLALWAAAFAAGRLGGAAVLLGTVMHMTLLGALLGLAPVLLYPHLGPSPLGLSPLEEQQAAGALMAGAGGAIYLAAALARLAPLLALEPGGEQT